MRRKIVYDPQRDYYALLGVSADATLDEIRQAYRQCVRELHPDLNPHRAEWATRQLQQVNEAYDVLREPALRQQYDRAREGRAPAAEPRAAAAAHGRTPAPDLPWWQQAMEQSERARQREEQASTPPPFWLAIAAWLRQSRLRGLEPGWLTLVGLWRGPYAQILATLSVALAFNIAFIVHALLNPTSVAHLQSLLSQGTVTPPMATPSSSPTPDRLYQACLNPDARIISPASGEIVGDSFWVAGTVSLDDLWAYSIELGYAGVSQPQVAPTYWRTVRAAPVYQTIPEPPVIEGLLTDAPIDLSGQPAGFYVLRLRVVLRNNIQQVACDVLVQH